MRAPTLVTSVQPDMSRQVSDTIGASARSAPSYREGNLCKERWSLLGGGHHLHTLITRCTHALVSRNNKQINTAASCARACPHRPWYAF